MAAGKTTRKKPTFEEQLTRVEQLITRMESGDLSLEESVQQYENGIRLLSALEKELGDAVQRLTVIRQGTDGKDTEVPLEAKA
ncbi:MAG: exodeoxyribonuclease VII small subunit [bacterium]|nr:exodeoxyribonuclease VII small subunit [bacterium]